MRCPECGHDDTRVIDSRPVEQGTAIRRRRSCESCTARFTTYERLVTVRLVRKRSGRLEPFDTAKLRRGLDAALADRAVSEGAVAEIIETVESEVHARSGSVPTEDIGRWVLEGLRDLDEVAYVRFASVYKEFSEASDFERALAELGESLNPP